ncbi:hypothetical protein M9980_01445 [Sphingomonas donggukensis]|uniref:Uncharacterized protein n=1 Tax=Sphingomonas donggukensis TaxID=2949093 RepID=A0ABY4TU40_9SPHN|nr:hypothetical protein [Sphingomonas donggukensis]URW75923.1 hypothetical protein M9980_01445 [Sphingomonas donggukensis]
MNTVLKIAAASLAILGSVPAVAQSYYTAKPAAELKKASLVTRSTLWKCADGVCAANKAGERDSVLCELVVQRVGKLESFSAGGAAFAPEALDKCNARAR